MNDTMGNQYRSAVVDTFRKRALRTAHIIDDKFPTYIQLAEATDAKEKFVELDLATDLYRLFRKHHIPCDVDNSVIDLKQEAERIRKSDLIVLDYNLAEGDTRMSISLARELARTKHFNTIILYTASEELDDVWLNLALGLRGGWSAENPSASTDAYDALGSLADAGVVVPPPPVELIRAYVVGRNPAAVADEEYRELFAKHDVAETLHSDMISALIRREILAILADDNESRDAPSRTVDGACAPGRPRWLQSGNCFIAIMGKRHEDGKEVTAERLFDVLDDALCEWRPNLPQILVSEIQNILELEAIATDELQLRDPNMQVSLCYYLLSALGDGDEGRTAEAVAPSLHTLLDKLVDNVRQKLVTDADLKGLANRLLLSEIERLKIPKTFKPENRGSQLFKFAKVMARGSSGETEANGALMRLNAFLSTEPFRGELTTGTVFSDATDYWICTTPACDMVDRPPGPNAVKTMQWSAVLHPMKPIIATRLQPIDNNRALKDAEDNRFVFLDFGGTFEAFEFSAKNSGPKYEFFFLDEGGKITHDGTQAQFAATRIVAADEGKRELKPFTLKVVGQVRPNYASRFLQQTGQWLSRIGVDFVRGGLG